MMTIDEAIQGYELELARLKDELFSLNVQVRANKIEQERIKGFIRELKEEKRKKHE